MECGLWVLLTILFSATFMASSGSARRAACHNPLFGNCYGILHTCPAACPALCEVDCTLCKPYCACDRPGAVCQDPLFVGGDGVMFYFHGRKDKDFCLVSDSELHINTHFIGKTGRRGRDFTWVQAIGVLFHPHHRLYNMVIQLDQQDVGGGPVWRSAETGLTVERQAETNQVKVEVEGLFEIQARTREESRAHGYGVPEDDCYAHLELNLKLGSLSSKVDGVLGKTYRASYRSRVKMAASSHIFAPDCAVSNYGELFALSDQVYTRYR